MAYSIDYLAISMFLSGIGVDISKDEKIKSVGLKLLRLRAMNEQKKVLEREGLPYLMSMQHQIKNNGQS